VSELYDLVVACENQLGWTIPEGVEPWSARMKEVGKLKRVLSVRREVSIADLQTALAYCKRRHEPIDSPLGLFGKVNVAKELAVVKEPPRTDVTVDWEAALLWELMNPDRLSDAWSLKLRRVHPAVRAELLADWRAAGRGVR
jgi:hypothetical protein